MSDENDKKWFDKKISRRDFLKKAGMVGAGAAIGASGAGAIFANMFSGKTNQVVGNEEENISRELLLLFKKTSILRY